MTTDEAIEIIECGEISNRWGEMGEEVEKMAIKALKQEAILDKIRAEIKEQDKERCFDEYEMRAYRTGLYDAIYIIDKYKAESEAHDADSN